MYRFEKDMILYRPVGLPELELIYDGGMKAFPARLPKQPIFYPVLQLEYARQTASGWNTQQGLFAGYVTQFKVEDQYISRFEEHAVGGSPYQELWIPAAEMEEFNRHITGHIRVVEAHFGDGFQGFIPEKFALQGKNAVEQFTVLADSYLYKRMDFYLEIKRNHKAIFLNYPFWLKHDFKNPGLKEKVLQAIKEAWFTSFPHIPLPNPVQRDPTPVDPSDAAAGAQPPVDPVGDDGTFAEQTDPDPWDDPVPEKITPVEPVDSNSLIRPIDKDISPVRQTDSPAIRKPVPGDVPPVQPANTHFVRNPVSGRTSPSRQTDSHFRQGIQRGLSGQYHEAIAKLSQAVEEDPDDVVAQTSLGVAFQRLGEADQALASYETALKIDAIYAEAHYFRANILYRFGDVREAIAGYTIAVGLNPELIEAHQQPAPQDRLTDYTGAPAEIVRIAKPAYRILDLNKSLESNPGQADLIRERAAEYYRLRNYAQVIADYTSYLALQPDDATALHSRGIAYEQLGQTDRALDDYQRAIALNPQLSNVYIQRGITFGKTGNYRQSILSLTDAIRLAPQNPDGYFNRGTSYFQLGDFESAIADFSMTIQLASDDEDAYYWRGAAYEEAGRQRQAVADYRRFLTLSRNPRARQEIEHKLRYWNEEKQNRISRRSILPVDRQTTNQVPDQDRDLYSLLLALGDRALNSTWFGSGVNCYGENAEELYAFTDQGKPIKGRDLISIASGIRQTIAGDFQALDPGAGSAWIFLRAWEGSGFYIETDDPKITERLKSHFQSVEEVEGASPPFKGLFIRS